MTNQEKYEAQLGKTLAFLAKAHTAAEVAEKFGITPFCAYERIKALSARGQVRPNGKRFPAHTTGPRPQAWISF